MAKTLHSNNITFVDLTDTKKLDVHISSNLPTIQIYNVNTSMHSPDWTKGDKLKLTLTVYADSTDVTGNLSDIKWYRQIGNNIRTLIEDNKTNELIISNNELTDPLFGGSIGVISYICVVTYNARVAENQITFSRTDTGLNGKDGVNAPPVLVQYSVYGDVWTEVLNPTIHKYAKYSYDGGTTWTAAIKIMGEDGTSVVIKGTAYTYDELVAGTTVNLFADSSHLNPINKDVLSTGDSYLVDGYLCVYSDDTNGFICTGTIQGPAGNNGISSYVFIQYALDANGTSMSDNPSGKTYIGIHVSDKNKKPDNASSYTWSKFVGESAKSIILNGSSQIFRVDKFDAVTPAMITVKAQVVNTLITDWTFSINGGQTFSNEIPDGITLNTSDNLVIIDGTSLKVSSIVINASDGIYSDTYTVYKVFDGSDGSTGKDGQSASMAFLTNENVTFSANASGQVPYTVITTNVVAYNGTTKVTPKVYANNIQGLPIGMTAVVKQEINNEIPIDFIVADNSLLGSISNINSSMIRIPVEGPVYTNLIFTWNKVNAGAKGEKGDAGTSAYTVLLTNESHVFAGDVSNAMEGSAETQILAYKGTEQQKVRIDSIDGKAPGLIDTNTNTTGLKFVCDKLSSDDNGSPKITFKCTTALTKRNGTIPIKLTVDGVQFEKIFTYSVALKGGIGEQGKQGVAGKSMTGIKEYYLASASATGVTTTTNGWTETMQTVTSAKKYLWNYEVIVYSDGTTTTINPVIIGAYGDTGSTGKGVSSIVEEYYQSTSATAQSDGTWSTTPPAWANGKYIWTRSIVKYTDNTTSTTSPVCITGQQGGTGIGIDSVDVWYYQSTSATALSGGSWSTKSPTWADGKYIWTKTITTYTNATTDETAAVCITGQKGATGVGIKSVTEYYLATSLSSGVTTSTSGWDTKVQTTTSTNKYLWNYEVITYTDNSTSTLTPIIIGVYGDTGSTGKGISGVKEYYLATTLASGVTTATSGWTPEMQVVTSTKKYLWNYEVITYTDNTTSTVAPILIGVYGDKGDTGAPATSYWLVSSASAIQKTSTGTIAVTPSTLTFTGKSKTGTNAPVDYACRWIIAYSTDGTNYTNLYTSAANEASKSITVSTTYKTIRARMYMAGGTTALIDEQIIPVVSDGVQGPKGNDAYTVMLTNESHIFAGDVSNAIAGSATTQVLAYNGSTAQTVTIVSVNSKTATTADTDTGIAGLKFKCSALSGASPTITFTCTTSFVSKNGAIPIVLSVGGVSFTKMFTYSIAFKGTTGSPGNPGSPGTPASLVDITPSALYFKSTTGKGGAFTPDYIYLYPRFQTVAYSKWEYSTNGGTSWTTVTSGSNGLTIGTYNSVAYSLQIAKNSALYTDTVTSISFRCVSSNVSVYDTVSIAKIYDVVDLQIGGRNLILASNVSYSNSEYRVASYNMSEDWEFNATYTLTLKGAIEEGKIFGAWANGSGTRVATLTYDAVKDVYTSTFVTPATIASQTPKVINIYNTPSTTPGSASIEWIKLEKGNKATDWSPAPEDLKSITFQLYAPKGYLLTNDTPEVTLETFAYDGSQQITNATFAWYSWNGESWVVISGATGASLTINRSNVFKSNVYKCEMTYGGKVYTATATVEDKTDIYDSLIHITSKYSPSNRLYWVLYSTVYSEEGEKDELLGPVSVMAPTSPATGAYWYKIDETNYTVTLMKYSGTAWVATTDKQEFVYDWFMLNDTNSIVTLGERSKVKIVTSDNFSRTCSIQCNVLDQELAALTHSNQVINDPSDPIVSETEPINPVNGQLWIKTNANGSYMLLVWDASNSKWVVSEADTQKKVYVQKPTTYNEGDIWIVAAEYEPDAYVDGVLQKETIEGVTKVVKHIAGTMLMAQYASQTYKDSDWIDALKYTKALDKVNKQMDIYNQFFTFDNTGMTMKAKSLNGQISEFSTKLTNTELGFYQGENKVAYINNNQLNISKAEITNGMVIGGTEPMLQIGNFVIMQESNGSLSIGLKS